MKSAPSRKTSPRNQGRAATKSNGMLSYTGFGLRIHSELPMPELVESDGKPDVIVRLGKVDRRRPQSATAGKYFWATSDDCCVFEERVATFRIRGGREITVEPAPGVGDRILRSYLLGPAMIALLYQRGKLTLHGSAVAIKGRVVAFLGGPGWGKSTTAAALHARGHEIVTDDAIVIAGGEAEPTVLPGFPQFKLWPDAAAAIGADPETLPRLHEDFEKRVRRVTDRISSAALPFSRAYVLAEGSVARIEPLSQRSAIVEFVRHSLGTRLLAAGGRERHFVQCAELVRKVPVRRLERPLSLDQLDAVAKLVEEDVV